MYTPENSPSVVVIGGGNGTSAILEGVRHYSDDITAVVNTTDNGGSTGQLRTQYPGLIGVGDIRQCMRALATNQAMAMEFDRRGLCGHTVGNLALVQAAEEAGGVDQIETAIAVWSDRLEVHGHVVPASLEPTDLVLTLSNGEQIYGEYEVAHSTHEIRGNNGMLSLSPLAAANTRAIEAVQSADIVVVAPGNLYGSVVPALLPDGLTDAINASAGQVLIVGNLLNNNKTRGFTVEDHVKELCRLTGLRPNAVIAHDGTSHPNYDPSTPEAIKIGKDDTTQIITADLIGNYTSCNSPYDRIAAVRSKVRHNGHMIGSLIIDHLAGQPAVRYT